MLSIIAIVVKGHFRLTSNFGLKDSLNLFYLMRLCLKHIHFCGINLKLKNALFD